MARSRRSDALWEGGATTEPRMEWSGFLSVEGEGRATSKPGLSGSAGRDGVEEFLDAPVGDR